MILFITPRFRHEKSDKDDCRLIVMWLEGRLIIKEWDEPELDKAYVFSDEWDRSPSVRECPKRIINIVVGKNGIGCRMSMKAADGEHINLLASYADFIEGTNFDFCQTP